MFLLDTDICSYIIRERPLSVLEKFRQLPARSLAISVITRAELLYGVARTQSKKVNRQVVDEFTGRLMVRDWDAAAAEQYGVLRAAMEAKGKVIGNMDMMIAAHALSLGATVVTNNTRHFSVVPKLKTANWA